MIETAPRIAVVVPTYNEIDNLPRLVDAVFSAAPNAEFLIVDDASPDGTGELADKIAAAEPRFHVIHRTANRGYAPSCIEGLSWCRQRELEYVFTMDGDLSHDPGRMPTMLEHARRTNADLVIGSRYVKGGAVEAEWGPVRRAVSEMGSAYARTMIGTATNDCTSGYRCYRRGALDLVQWDRLRSDGYSFLIETLAALVSAGAKIEEVPITYIDRQQGHSKISRRIVIEALGETTLIGVRRLLGRQ